MKQLFPDPRDVAARKALAAKSPASIERILEQAAASCRWTADQLRESRANHPLSTHEEAIAQFRRFRRATYNSSSQPLP